MQNLAFLEECSASINQLLISINTKIESLDMSLAQAIADGFASHQSELPNEYTSFHQDRMLKRTQLQMLKQNAEIIGINLNTLSQQAIRSPATTIVDRYNIRSIIEEAGTIYALLNTDDEDDVDDELQELQFGDDVQNMDAFISQYEEDTIATEEMIANVEYLSLFDDDGSIHKLNDKFDALFLDSELVITSQNFDPNDISVRPKMWKEVRTKRLLIKEYVSRLEGILEDDIIENRKAAIAKVCLFKSDCSYNKFVFGSIIQPFFHPYLYV